MINTWRILIKKNCQYHLTGEIDIFYILSQICCFENMLCWLFSVFVREKGTLILTLFYTPRGYWKIQLQHSAPRPPPPPLPVPSENYFSFSVFLCFTGPLYWRERGRGWAWSQIIPPQESLALYKSFNPYSAGSTVRMRQSLQEARMTCQMYIESHSKFWQVLF